MSTVLDRFMNKVNKNGPTHRTLKTKCWVWTASIVTHSIGYGQFQGVKGCSLAHRASWILYNGEIPEGLFVLHKCDNPICVNPKHLYLGTHADNMKDMKDRGRVNKSGPHNPVSGDDHYSHRTPEKMSRGIKHSKVMLIHAQRGEDRYNARLTEEIVRWCRVRYKQGGISITQLAVMFNISRMPMWQAIRRQTWKHVK